jgi:hypothetical protein
MLRLQTKRAWLENLLILLFTVLGFLVMGYHPGMEDDGVYLTAVKADLNPALFPHNADFFRLQLQATLFDSWMAHFVQWTGISLAWAELFWQFASLFVILWATARIAGKLFAESQAKWAAVAMVAAMFTLPVAGTALNIADQHLHPRNLATALILVAVSRILEDKRWQAVPLLMLAFVLHPIMAAMGISFCVFEALSLTQQAARFQWRFAESTLASAVPLSWILEPVSPAWRQALNTKSYYFLFRWTWYEWLGALAPLFLFWVLGRVALRHGQTRLSRFALAVVAYGVFQQIVAMAILTPNSLERLTPLQPMRYLQLVYIFMALVAGGLLGRFLLKGRAWRWVVYLLVFNGSMFLVTMARTLSFPQWPAPTPGCKPSIGSGKTRLRMRISRLTLSIWPHPARAFTASAHWLSGASYPMASRTRRWSRKCQPLPPHGSSNSRPRPAGRTSSLRISSG